MYCNSSVLLETSPCMLVQEVDFLKHPQKNLKYRK
jgi:hypothetical protein